METVQEAITHWGTPAIFNTDQGSQFTSDAYTESSSATTFASRWMEKGAWRDNVLVVRLLRSIKYEEIYLKAYDGVRAARCGIGQYLEPCHSKHPYQAHKQATPDEAYFAALPFAQVQAA